MRVIAIPLYRLSKQDLKYPGLFHIAKERQISMLNKSTLQEQLSSLYLRLNGYLISGFIVHAPIGEFNSKKQLRTNRTEIDLIGLRFPYNKEPERKIEPSPYLQVSSEYIDILICEVKGGTKSAPQFNEGLRNNPEAIRSVLRWIGVFKDDEIDQLIEPVKSMLGTQIPYDHLNYRQIIVPSRLVQNKIRLRAIFFAPDRTISQEGQTKYIHGQEIINYIWNCLSPEHQRSECETRYDFTLWGTYEEIVRFFKSTENKPLSIQEIYTAFQIK